MQILVPENVKKVIYTLEKSGYEAYVVGGSVRDSLLGLTPTDFDICTSALPENIMGLFEKTVPTGIKHGTVTVISGGIPIEVTTFRTDGAYNDFRHPQKVKFVNDLKGDLSRRDFTVNALCYNDSTGIIDCFNGIYDINHKMLRTVGNADMRFKEDALRILRLFRFASTLDFTIEKDTYKAAINNAHLLKNVSCERIREELIKLSCGINPAAVLPLLNTDCIPGFKSNSDVTKIPSLPKKNNLKFFAFLHLCTDNISDAISFLKCSNAFKDYSLRNKNALELPCKTKPDIKRLLRLLETDIFDILCYKSAICEKNTEEAIAATKEIIKCEEPYKISQLAITGDDLKDIGYSGKEVGEKLELLLENVIINPDLNSKDKLLYISSN